MKCSRALFLRAAFLLQVFGASAIAQVAPCQSGVQLTSLTGGVTNYSSSNYLSASGSVDVNTNGSGGANGSSFITFQAGTSICLGPGFQAAVTGSGAGFHAFIGAGPAPLAISASTPPTGYLGQGYSLQMVASGGTPSYLWSLGNGSPPGLSINSTTGLLSGTPTTTGAFSFSVNVIDSSSSPQTASAPIQITTKLPFTVSPSSFPTVAPTTGTLTLGVTPASGLSWTATSSQTWLQVTPNSGGVSGTVSQNSTTASRAATINVTSGTYVLSVSVTQLGPLAVSPQTMPTGYIGNGYSGTLVASGGLAPFVWSLASGSVPPSLTLNANGTITGTLPGNIPPTAYPFTVSVHDSSSQQQIATGSFSITTQIPITLSPGSITNIPAAGGSAGSIGVTTGTSNLTWSSSASNWLTAGASKTGSGTIPVSALQNTSASQRTVNILVSCDGYSTTIPATQLSPVVVTGPAPTTVYLGTSYTIPVTASGGLAPYTLSVSSGALPPGMSFSTLPGSATGNISGIPSASGSFSFSVKAQDSLIPAEAGNANFSITGVAPFTYTSAPSSLPPVAANATSVGTINLAAALASTAWSASVPTGSGFGLGTTGGTGSAAIPITVTANTSVTPRSSTVTLQSGSYQVNVPVTQAGVAALTMPASQFPNGYYYTQYTVPPIILGGTPGYYLTILNQSAWPSNLSIWFSGTAYSIWGAPLGPGTISFQVTDSSTPPQTYIYSQSISVYPPLASVTPSSFPNVLANSSNYAVGDVTVVTQAPQILWYLVSSQPWLTATGSNIGSGSLPVTVNQANSGTARTANVMVWSSGIQPVATIPVTQDAGTIPVTISTTSLPSGYVGEPYSASLIANDGVLPYTWSSTNLPSPYSLSSLNGTISGTPTTAGTSPSFSVKVTDGTGSSATVNNLTIMAASPLSVSPTSLTVPAIAGPVSSIVTETTNSFSWTAAPTSSTTWITGTFTGNASGAFVLSAATNNTGASRTGTILITGSATGSIVQLASVSVTQPALGPGLNITSVPPVGTQWATYSSALTASGGTGALHWSLTPASFNGLSVGSGTALLRGTPASAGTFNGTLTVTDSSAPPQTANLPISMTFAPPLVTSTQTLSEPSTGNSGQTVTITTPFAWTSTAPSWIALSPSSGSSTSSVTLNVLPNTTGSQRVGTLQFTSTTTSGTYSQSVTVTESAASNILSLSKEYIHLGSRVIAVENQ